MRRLTVLELLLLSTVAACSARSNGFGDPPDVSDAGADAADVRASDMADMPVDDPSEVGEECRGPRDCVEDALCIGTADDRFVCMAKCTDTYSICDDGSVCLPVMTQSAAICYIGGSAEKEAACASNLDCATGLHRRRMCRGRLLPGAFDGSGSLPLRHRRPLSRGSLPRGARLHRRRRGVRPSLSVGLLHGVRLHERCEVRPRSRLPRGPRRDRPHRVLCDVRPSLRLSFQWLVRLPGCLRLCWLVGHRSVRSVVRRRVSLRPRHPLITRGLACPLGSREQVPHRRRVRHRLPPVV